MSHHSARRVDLSVAAAVLIILAVELTARLWLLAGADQVAAGKDRAAKMISGVPG